MEGTHIAVHSQPRGESVSPQVRCRSRHGPRIPTRLSARFAQVWNYNPFFVVNTNSDHKRFYCPSDRTSTWNAFTARWSFGCRTTRASHAGDRPTSGWTHCWKRSDRFATRNATNTFWCPRHQPLNHRPPHRLWILRRHPLLMSRRRSSCVFIQLRFAFNPRLTIHTSTLDQYQVSRIWMTIEYWSSPERRFFFVIFLWYILSIYI